MSTPAAPGRAYYMLLTNLLLNTSLLTTYQLLAYLTNCTGRTWSWLTVTRGWVRFVRYSCLPLCGCAPKDRDPAGPTEGGEVHLAEQSAAIDRLVYTRQGALDSDWARGLIGLNKAIGALPYTRAHV